jgi:PAS domain S-box-containing protein
MIDFRRFVIGTSFGRRTGHIQWIVLAAGLVLTAAVALQMKVSEDRLKEQDFVAGCGELQRAIVNRLDDHARILLSGAALFKASEEVTRAEWRIFSQSLKVEKQLPGIQGFGVSLLIPRSELPRHTGKIRSEGFPEYQVTPEGDRELYSSIVYLEPFSGRNLRAFGYDMFSEPIRRSAMERARDTAAAALSGKVVLVQETGKDVQAGTLMYVPIYRNDLPTETVDQRRAAILGWVYSPYRMRDLIEGIEGAGNLHKAMLKLSIYDGERPSPEALLFAPPDGPGSRGVGVRFKREIPVDFNGHYWTLCITQSAEGLLTGEKAIVWLTLLGGTLSTLLLLALIRVLLNTRAKAQQLAEAMTVDLQKSEESLWRVTERLSLAAKAGGVGIWDYDVVNNHLVWDDQMFQLYGITREQFSGAYEAWQAGLHPDDRQRGDEAIQRALQGAGEFNIEFRVLWPDGSLRHVRGLASVQRDLSGRPVRMIGTNWDITAPKRMEEALRESESNFRTFFESMTDMIMVGTPEGRILFTNNAVTRTLGYAPDELKGMHLLDVHPANSRKAAEDIFASIFRGERESCPLPLESKGGVLVPVETRVWSGKWNSENCLFGISKNLSAEKDAQQRFERLFRNNPSQIALCALPEMDFLDVNDSFLMTLGYSLEDVIGHSAAEFGLFVNPEQHASVMDQLQKISRIVGVELQVRCKDGVILDGLFSGEVIVNQGRRYLLLVMIDITARKRAEKELARLSVIQRDLMRLATDFVNVALEQQDNAIDESLATMGRLILADRAYLFAYDFSADVMCNTHEWCGAGITPEIHNLQAVPNSMVPEWVSAHRRGECIHIPSVAAVPADSYLWQVLAGQGIRSLITLPLMQGSACLGFVGFDAVHEERVWKEEEVALLRVLAELYAHFEARRATERATRTLQKDLTQACDAAQAAAVAKNIFLANMSHEIRTPLNAILGYAQIMQRDCRSCPNGHRLKAITGSGEHLLELLTDLLELVRSDAHSITLAPCTFDFYQALEDVRLMFVRNLAAQSLTMELACLPGVPHFMHADSGKIRQILVNLIGNAVKFTEKGGVRLTASVLPESTPDGLMIAVDVEDTGPGIEEEDLGRIFELFEQTATGRKGGKGTGLGLSLSRRYARALGGDITVTSHYGEGSCFRFTFRALAASGEAALRIAPGIARRLAQDQRAIRVLVVDDDSSSRDMLKSMLEPVGFTVETAASAAQALSRLREPETIHLVLMDKRMPEMNGYEAISRIRELPVGGTLPVVVVTASGFADERVPAMAAGANGYVSKPVRREQLLEEIGRLCAIEYEYEQGSPRGADAGAPAGIDLSLLSRLPEEQRRLLDQALRRGDILQLREMVDAIAQDNAGLAAGMHALLDTYNYDRLRRLLDSVKGATV